MAPKSQIPSRSLRPAPRRSGSPSESSSAQRSPPASRQQSSTASPRYSPKASPRTSIAPTRPFPKGGSTTLSSSRPSVIGSKALPVAKKAARSRKAVPSKKVESPQKVESPEKVESLQKVEPSKKAAGVSFMRHAVEFREIEKLESDIQGPSDTEPPEGTSMLARARTILLEMEHDAAQENDEVRNGEAFLDLPRAADTEDLSQLSPSQRQRIRLRPIGDREEETEFWTETEESEDEVLGLRDSGEDRFYNARVVAGKRQMIVETISRDVSNVRENLNYMNMKTNLRLNELKQVINRQEKRMNALRTALRKATVKEMNQIISAGWSRKGDFGLLDLDNILGPFAANREHFPRARLQATGRLLPERRPTRKVQEPLLVPPRVPKIRGQRVDYPCITPCTATPCGEDFGKNAVCSYEASTSTGEEEVESDTHSGFKTVVNQLETLMPGREISRAEINTFVKIGLNKAGGDIPYFQKESQLSKATVEEIETPSVSSEDLERIDRTLESIDIPQLCGIPLEGSIGKLLNVQVEPTHVYKEMVRKKLYSYYRDEKRFRRSCIGVLPGGLSLVRLNQPPEPNYPLGGLVEEMSSVSSEGILSDILSELGEAESEEEDFAAVFDKAEKEMLEAAASEEASVFGKRTVSKKSASADIFTTTFQVGVPPRPSNVLVELRRQELIANKEANEEEEAVLPLPPCPEFCEKMDICGVCTEKMEPVRAVRPAEITEFWQLSHDREQPLWIFRGRIVKPLNIECET